VTQMDAETLWSWVLIAILAILVADVWIRKGWKDPDDDDIY